MKRRPVLLFLLLLAFSFAGAQSDSCNLRISLLTCNPGEDLYSTFGHSAIRVTNPEAATDIIFNYGTFEFNEDFYVKFVRGKLRYFVSTDDFSSFRAQYTAESRSMHEQVLQLTCEEKTRLVAALYENLREENRYYQYDFLFDNCSTRLRDIVAKNTDGDVRFGNVLPKQIPTFRNLLYTYLDNGGQHWSKFGIDLLLGSRLDKKVTNEQAMFLPDYLMRGFEGAQTSGHRLVSPAQTILTMPTPIRGSSVLQPMVVFCLLLALMVVLSFVPRRGLQRAIRVFDFALFFVLGLIGCLLVVMWTATDHALCKDNYNLLWALPTHTIAAFFLWHRGRFIQYYLLVTIIIQAFLLIGWIFLPQQFNLAFLPIILLVLLRAWLLILKPHAHEKNPDTFQQ